MTAHTAHLLHNAERDLRTARNWLDAAAEYARQSDQAVEDGELPEAYRLAVAACDCEEKAQKVLVDHSATAPLRDWLATEQQLEGKKDEDAA